MAKGREQVGRTNNRTDDSSSDSSTDARCPSLSAVISRRGSTASSAGSNSPSRARRNSLSFSSNVLRRLTSQDSWASKKFGRRDSKDSNHKEPSSPTKSLGNKWIQVSKAKDPEEYGELKVVANDLNEVFKCECFSPSVRLSGPVLTPHPHVPSKSSLK